MGLDHLRKKERISVGDWVFVPQANRNFCLAKVVQADGCAHLEVAGTPVPVPVTKVHFSGWNRSRDMYVLQSELYEVSKEAFQAKLRVARAFNPPIAFNEVKTMMKVYEAYNFGNSKF